MLIFVLPLVFILYKIFRWLCLTEKDNVHKDYEESWFGREDPPAEDDTSIRPFKIEVPDAVLEDLKLRLQRTRLEEPVQGVNFRYGFNPDYLKTILQFWLTEYDWRLEERQLNRFPHFKTRIEGIDVHFVHVKPCLPHDSQIKVYPLMLVHGWPGSFTEFLKMIPLLTNPVDGQDFVFEVIIPSIPGFGFSEAAHRRGLNARATARMFICLMSRLGHNKFYLQGGDWGSFIISLMARYYPEKVLGIHLNCFFIPLRGWNLLKMLLIAVFPWLVTSEEYRVTYPLRKKLKTTYQETGYFHMQSTKPDTLGCAMSDSPAGAAAYLLEKFTVGTDPKGPHYEDGDLTKKFTLEELLTNVMVYWVNNNFTGAARFYKENLGEVVSQKHERRPITVPSAVALFPNEFIMWPKMLMTSQLLDLVHYNIMPRGGHFAALEEPVLLTQDIVKFVTEVQKRSK